MFFHPAAFFFYWIASRECVSCETTFVCIDVQDRGNAQQHAVQCFIERYKNCSGCSARRNTPYRGTVRQPIRNQTWQCHRQAVRIAPKEYGNAPSSSGDHQNLYSSLPCQAVRAGELTQAIPKEAVFFEPDHSGTREFTHL